jgi:hypothetical protein
MIVKYTYIPIFYQEAFKTISNQNWYFWYGNIPSGNPDPLFSMPFCRRNRHPIVKSQNRLNESIIFFSIASSLEPGLPDGIFSYQKSRIGRVLEGFGMENVGKFYDYL